MQIRRRLKLGVPTNDFEKTLDNLLFRAWLELSTLLNAGLGFVDNFNCQKVAVADSGTINTEFTVAHTLKRIPEGFLVININKGGVVYSSGTGWTTSAIYLKCSAANAALTVIIF